MVTQLNTAQREQTRGGEQILQAVEQLREHHPQAGGRASRELRARDVDATRAGALGTRLLDRGGRRRLHAMFGLGIGRARRDPR